MIRETSTTVLRALDLLGLLLANPKGMTLPEITLALNQPRTNVLRLLKSLELYGFAVRCEKRWQITPHFHAWATPKDRYHHLRMRYAPVLREVAAEIGELVLLGLQEGNGILILDFIQSDERIRVAPPETRHSLRYNAFGKLALSRREDFIDKLTDDTFREELESIRQSGIAWNREETVRGMIAMAMPGFANLPAEPMLAIAWPTYRFSPEKAKTAARVVRASLKRHAGNFS